MHLDDEGNLLEKGYLTLPQLVRYIAAYYPLLACSYPTMAKRLEDGDIAYIEVGKQKRVTKEAIDAYIEKCMHPTKHGTQQQSTTGEALGPLPSSNEAQALTERDPDGT